jgi:hypothetical protein
MTIPDELLRAVRLLSQLDESVVYVGGMVAPLYFQRLEFTPHARPTVDVDCVVNVLSYVALQPIQNSMRKIGFSEGREPGDPICRWCGHDLIIDVMPLSEEALGFSNPWYAAGWDASIIVESSAGPIAILDYGHFLATKLEAHNNRSDDVRTSHDLEDIILTLAARESLAIDRQAFTKDVREFLRLNFRKIFKGAHQRDIFPAYLPSGMEDAEKRVREFLVALES